MENITFDELINKYRKLLFVIKIIPFIRNFIYIIFLLAYFLKLNENIYNIADYIIFFAPLEAIFWIWVAYSAGLCRWYKTTVLVPIIGITMAFTHSFIYEITEYAKYMNLVAVILCSALTIIGGIKILWKRKIC